MLLVVLLLLSGVAFAAKKPSPKWNTKYAEKFLKKIKLKHRRFELFVKCRPIRLIVEGLEPESQLISLTRADLIDFAKKEISAAHLYEDKKFAASALQVIIDVRDGAYHVSVNFYKFTDDPWTKSRGLSVTWEIVWTGAHGGGYELILYATRMLTKKFLKQYLRVNAQACKEESMKYLSR